MMGIDRKFWNGTRWDAHLAFKTVTHRHVSCYFPKPGHDTCGIKVVGCADGRWYIEDSWGGDARGHDKVWDPYDESGAEPHFFATEEDAVKHAVSVVAEVSGVFEGEIACF